MSGARRGDGRAALSVRVLRELLDRTHHDRRCRPPDATRPKELLDKGTDVARVALAPDRGDQLTPMGLEVGCDIDEAALLPQQIRKVQRALLAVGEFRCEDRQHGASEDTGLELSAGVEPD